MSTSIAQRVKSIHEQIGKANQNIAGLENDLRVLIADLANQIKQRQAYHLLDDIYLSLNKLNELGASELFWGSSNMSQDDAQQLLRVRRVEAELMNKVSFMEQSRIDLEDKIKKESMTLFLLKDELAELTEEIERAKNDYVLSRQANIVPFQPVVMPWTRQGEDENRFFKILILAFVLSVLIAWLLPKLRQPPEKFKAILIPEHIAQIIKRKQEEKLNVQEKLQEQLTAKKDINAASTEAKSKIEESQQARAVAQTKGVLAFKNNFADLMEDKSPVKMGAQARILNSGKTTAGSTSGGLSVPGEASTSSIITSQATGGSGGINTAALSQQGAGSGGGGKSITGAGVRFARVESSSGSGVADDRPLSKSAGPARSDEEIQIVFDRYKAALYRIYNRELRINPSLRGKLVLRITIQPDGSVTACTVKSTDLASTTLSKEVVDRVLQFNFGYKEGVSALTILYPIDFLPAN